MSEKWNTVFADENLAKKIIVLSPEDAQKVLAENGYEFSMDEIMKAGKAINEMMVKIKAGQTGELSEDDLEDVSGGGHGTDLAVGFAIGAMIAITALGW